MPFEDLLHGMVAWGMVESENQEQQREKLSSGGEEKIITGPQDLEVFR